MIFNLLIWTTEYVVMHLTEFEKSSGELGAGV